MSAPEPLWPAEFNLDPNHCREVLAGEYDVPYEPKVILDLGANVGAFARWAKVRWPQAKVHCYEPQPANFALLKKSVSLYDLTNAELHETAVTDTNSHRPLFENGFNCGEWSLVKNFTTKGSVEVNTMDAADLPEADFLKIDVEGAEIVILGRLYTTKRLEGVNGVVLEYHADSVIEPIERLMIHCGFQHLGTKSYSEHRGLMKFLR